VQQPLRPPLCPRLAWGWARVSRGWALPYLALALALAWTLPCAALLFRVCPTKPDALHTYPLALTLALPQLTPPYMLPACPPFPTHSVMQAGRGV